MDLNIEEKYSEENIAIKRLKCRNPGGN